MRKILSAMAGMFLASTAIAQPMNETKAVAPAIDQENILNLDLSTGGRVVILMRPDKAPSHVERIRLLTRQKFYDGLLFHRVIDGFMAQTGDPQGTGEGGSELPDLEAEFNDLPHLRGAVSMARAAEENSANSQFFIMFQPMLRLDGRYTAFGRVIDGIEFVDAVNRGEPPAAPSRILRASIGSDNVSAPTPEEVAAIIAAKPAPASATPLETMPFAQPGTATTGTTTTDEN